MADSSESNDSVVNNSVVEAVTDTDVPDAELHQVDLECKEGDGVLDEEIQKVDMEANVEKIDSLYKEEPLVDVKRVVIRRRRLYNFAAAAIGLIALVILLTTLRSPKQGAITKKDASNEDKGTLYNTKQNTSDSSIPKFACANTIVSCPMNSNGTWTKLPEDILGESQNDYAGFATALSCDGSVLAVSSIYSNNQTGNVRVYKWENDEQIWTKMGNDIEGTSPDEEFGYSLTMSSDGFKIAIGSRKSSDKAVSVFTYVDQLWIPLGQDIQAEVAGDQSGRSISFSMDGTRIAIGASSNNGTASGAGHARIYEISESNGESSWVQLGQDLDGAAVGDQFGRSVSLSGDGRRAAVGGHTVDTTEGIVDAGQVRVFDYDSTTKNWIQVAASINGQKTDEYFGVAVSLSYDGRRLAIGSPDSDPYIFGVTRVYELTDVGWSQIGSNLFGGGNTIDLTLDGSRVAIGSKGNFANGVESGHLSVYDYDETTLSWSQVGDDINGNEGDKSATSVAISADGKRVVSSSPSSGSVNGTVNNGIVRVYDFC
jgi:hypothetical protein